MPELDSLRGIAILLVLLYHCFAQYGVTGLTGFGRVLVRSTYIGWSGVNLFFVLSGFLITGILLNTRGRADYYRRFYFRRALRILPAYYGLLAVLLILPRLGLINRHVSFSFAGLSFIYLSNLVDLFGVPAQYATLWSLSVEEHFYLLWPGLMRRISKTGAIIACGSILVICPVLRFAWGTRGYTWLVADGLALGALLAVVVHERRDARRIVGRFGAVAATAALLITAGGIPFGILHSNTHVGAALQYTVINLLYSGLLCFTLICGTSRPAIVRWRVLEFFGYISYGLYLIQHIALDLVARAIQLWFPTFQIEGHFGHMMIHFVVAGSLAIAMATLSRKYFEDPILSLKDRAPVKVESAATAAA